MTGFGLDITVGLGGSVGVASGTGSCGGAYRGSYGVETNFGGGNFTNDVWVD